MSSLRTVLIATVGILGGCAAAHRPTVSKSGPQVTSPSEPVIVRVVSRKRTITITASGHGALYTVTDPSGRVLVSRVTLDELLAGDPEMGNMIAPGATAWAGM